MKSFKIIYYILLASIVIIAGLLIISVFPITGNIKFMVVQSGSMEPAIKIGSIVMVKPVKEYKIGDVITFGEMTKDQESTTHRIYDIKEIEGKLVYITKGDANNSSDTKEIQESEVMGKVLLNIPYLGYAVDFTKKPLGFALIIIVPTAVIIGDEIKKIYGEVKKKKNNKVE